MSNPLFPSGYGGLADSRWSGIVGSVAESVGIDAHSTPGLMKVHQKLAKESATTITELCKASVACSDGSRLWFSSTSGKIWREVSGTYTLVYTTEYPDFDLRTANPTALTIDVNAQTDNIQGSYFKPDGLSCYILDASGGGVAAVFQYTLSTAWDISTATYASKTFAFTPQSNLVRGIFFRADGLKLYAVENGGSQRIFQYTLGTAWDISTMTYDGVLFNYTSQASTAFALALSAAGTKLFVFSLTDVYEYTLSTAWNISTASYVQSYNHGISAISVFVKADGTKFWTLSGAVVTQFELGTAWNLSTATAPGISYTVTSGYLYGLSFATDGSGFYVFNITELGKQYSLDPEDLNVQCFDATEFNEFIYYSTKTQINKVALANIATFSGVVSAGKFTDPQDGPRPMVVQNLQLFIGNGQNMSYVDINGVFYQTSAFNIQKPEIITTIAPYDIDVVIGTQLVNCGRALRWDTFSDSWSAEDLVLEKGIKAFLRDDNYLYAYAGESGRLYFYNGEKLEVAKRIRGTWNPSHSATVHHNSVGFFNGIPVFGLSTVAGTPCKMGVYTYGGYSRDYNRILDLAFPKGNTYDAMEVGAILVDGPDMRVAFADGVYKIDWAAKYEHAHIETRQLTAPADRTEGKTFSFFFADYVSLPASTAIDMKYRRKYADSFVSLTVVNDTDNEQVRADLSVPDVTSLQMRYDFTVNGNNAPEVENFAIE